MKEWSHRLWGGGVGRSLKPAGRPGPSLRTGVPPAVVLGEHIKMQVPSTHSLDPLNHTFWDGARECVFPTVHFAQVISRWAQVWSRSTKDREPPPCTLPGARGRQGPRCWRKCQKQRLPWQHMKRSTATSSVCIWRRWCLWNKEWEGKSVPREAAN